MKRRQLVAMAAILGALVWLSACLTVNIYFPVAEANKTAEEIVHEVYGIDKGKQEAPEKKPEQTSLLLRPLEWLAPRAAHAQEAMSVSNPEIDGLKAQIVANHGQLLPFYQGGQVGINKEGLLEVRNTDGLSLPDVGKVRRLVAADNDARHKLYVAVAEALKLQAQQVPQLKQIFADQWRKKAAPGWWYQNDSGAWVQK